MEAGSASSPGGQRHRSKSHVGCQECRRRKVKCDEAKPSCNRCLRRHERCSYLDHFQNTKVSGLTHTSRSTRRTSPEPALPVRNLQYSGLSNAIEAKVSYVTDLELTHHFLTSTYLTTWPRRSGQEVWRDDIFSYALQHPALLSGILATAAIHKITMISDPSAISRYIAIALRKRAEALNGFIPLLNAPTAENCVALFPLSILLLYWAFASKTLPQDLNILFTSPYELSGSQEQIRTNGSPVELFVELIHKAMGVYSIVGQTRPWLERTRLRVLMQLPQMESLRHIPENVDAALTRLEARLRHNDLFLGIVNRPSSRVSIRYLLRVREASDAFEVIIGWPVTLPPPFIAELVAKDSAALIILAYWVACFHRLDFWWARGWSADLVNDIAITVDETWVELLDWPKAAVGLT